MTINAGNDEIYEITIDGTQVREVTVDGVIAWVEANFDVRNLSAPNEVTEGDNFTITADVKNTGDGRDTQTISFNRGGSTNKTLKGGQTTTVSFGETINNSGDFTLKISSDNDSASQTVTVLTPANFDIRNLSAPNTVTEGNNFTVSADVVNTGQTSDTQTISFNRGGSTNRSLSGNSSTNVSFGETINNTGNFNLSISSDDDSESRNITVESAIPTSGLLHRYDFSSDQTTTSSVPDLAGGADATSVSFSGFDTINGVKSGDFDGVDDLVDAPASITQPADVFAVIEPDDAAFGRLGSTPGNNFLQAPRIRSGEWQIFAGSVLRTDTAVSTVPQITVSQFDGGDSAFRQNGTELASGDAGFDSYDEIRFGGYQNEANADWSFGEVLVYDPTASGYSVTNVESYLSDKWGITI